MACCGEYGPYRHERGVSSSSASWRCALGSRLHQSWSTAAFTSSTTASYDVGRSALSRAMSMEVRGVRGVSSSRPCRRAANGLYSAPVAWSCGGGSRRRGGRRGRGVSPGGADRCASERAPRGPSLAHLLGREVAQAGAGAVPAGAREGAHGGRRGRVAPCRVRSHALSRPLARRRRLSLKPRPLFLLRSAPSAPPQPAPLSGEMRRVDQKRLPAWGGDVLMRLLPPPLGCVARFRLPCVSVARPSLAERATSAPLSGERCGWDPNRGKKRCLGGATFSCAPAHPLGRVARLFVRLALRLCRSAIARSAPPQPAPSAIWMRSGMDEAGADQ